VGSRDGPEGLSSPDRTGVEVGKSGLQSPSHPTRSLPRNCLNTTYYPGGV